MKYSEKDRPNTFQTTSVVTVYSRVLFFEGSPKSVLLPERLQDSQLFSHAHECTPLWILSTRTYELPGQFIITSLFPCRVHKPSATIGLFLSSPTYCHYSSFSFSSSSSSCSSFPIEHSTLPPFPSSLFVPSKISRQYYPPFLSSSSSSFPPSLLKSKLISCNYTHLNGVTSPRSQIPLYSLSPLLACPYHTSSVTPTMK